MSHTNVLDGFTLDGKLALVTGGARGLGRPMALALAEAGADVVLAGRTIANLDETATELAAATGRRIVPFLARACGRPCS